MAMTPMESRKLICDTAGMPYTDNVLNALLSDKKLKILTDMELAGIVYKYTLSRATLTAHSREIRKIARIMSNPSVAPEQKAVLWLMTRRLHDIMSKWNACGSAFSMSTSIKLVDFKQVRRNIRRTHTPGWEKIVRIDTYDIRNNFGLSRQMLVSDIERDIPEHLIVHLAVNGMNITCDLVKLAMRRCAINTLMYLLKNEFDEVSKVFKPEDMLFFACSNPFEYTPDQCRDIISELEGKRPGIVANTVDPFGYNALWYTLRDTQDMQEQPQIMLEKVLNGEILAETNSNELRNYLTELGCDPKATNHLGLSFQLCKDMEEKLVK